MFSSISSTNDPKSVTTTSCAPILQTIRDFIEHSVEWVGWCPRTAQGCANSNDARASSELDNALALIIVFLCLNIGQHDSGLVQHGRK
jgi:hypothetical protein